MKRETSLREPSRTYKIVSVILQLHTITPAETHRGEQGPSALPPPRQTYMATRRTTSTAIPRRPLGRESVVTKSHNRDGIGKSRNPLLHLHLALSQRSRADSERRTTMTVTTANPTIPSQSHALRSSLPHKSLPQGTERMQTATKRAKTPSSSCSVQKRYVTVGPGTSIPWWWDCWPRDGVR